MVRSPVVEQIRMGKLQLFTYKDDKGRVLETFKSPLQKKREKGRVFLRKTGFINDDGIDHKGLKEDKALFAFVKEHYKYYRHLLKRNETELTTGQMGEHLVLTQTNESETFIGDTYEFGEAIIQVSQPRLPCWRTSYHVNDADLAEDMVEAGLTGWHFRVLKEGYVKDKTPLTLIDRPYPQWSVALCHEALHTDKHDTSILYELSQCEALSSQWRYLFKERFKGKVINYKKRFYGPMNDY